jgi:hypothetical protein
MRQTFSYRGTNINYDFVGKMEIESKPDKDDPSKKFHILHVTLMDGTVINIPSSDKSRLEKYELTFNGG